MPHQVSKFIDWLRYTVPHDTPREQYLPLAKPFDDSGEVLAAFPNYSSTRAFVCGRADWAVDKPEQRLMVTLTGKDLSRMRDMNYSDKSLLSWIYDIPGIHVTRLDLAIDTNDTRLSPVELKKDFKTERFATRARSMSEIKREGKQGEYMGHTVYVGSRTSEQFLRVYDKAAEQGTSDHLTRLELELKGHKAFEAVVTIARNSAPDAIQAAFNRFFQWSNAGWQDIASGSVLTVTRLDKPETDGWLKWVHTVALPAVQAAAAQGDEKVRAAIKNMID